MKTKLQIPPGSELFAECDGRIVFNGNGVTDKGDWTFIDKIFSTHKKKIISACACWEWSLDLENDELSDEQISLWTGWVKE
jgi:hypothetical protein